MIKKLLMSSVVIAMFALASPSYAFGINGNSIEFPFLSLNLGFSDIVNVNRPTRCRGWCRVNRHLRNMFRRGGNNEPRQSRPARSVPEIDAAGAAISLALVAGIVAVGRERRKRKLAK